MLATVYRASCVLKECSTPRTFGEHRGVSIDKYQTILECLLDAGANPNHFIGAQSSSPWSLALQETYSMTPCAESLTWCNILRALLRPGANLNETARDKKKSFVRHSSALVVISTMIIKFRDEGDLIQQSQGDGTDIYQNAKEKHKSTKFLMSKVISSAKKRLSFR